MRLQREIRNYIAPLFSALTECSRMYKILSLRLLFFLLVVLSFNTSGQNLQQNQYLEEIQRIRGKGKQNIQLFHNRFELGESYLREDPDSAMLLAIEAKKTAEKLGIDTCIAWANMLIGDCYLERFEFDKSLDFYWLAEPVFRKHKAIQGLCETINGIGYAYMCIDQFDSSQYYISKHKLLAQQLNNAKELGEAHYYLGNTLMATSSLDTALANFLIALSFFKEAEDYHNLADINYSIAELYAGLGNNKASIQHHIAAVKYDLQLNRLESAQDNYYQISKLFITLGDLKKAEMYLQKGLAVNPEPSPTTSAMTALAKGDLLYAQEAFEEALEQYKHAELELRHIADIPTYDICQLSIASCYEALGSYQALIEYYNSTVSKLPHVDSNMVANYYHLLGKAHAQIAPPNFKKALYYLEEGLKMAKRFRLPADEQEFYSTLSELHQRLGNSEKALHYLQQSNLLADSLNQVSNKRLFASLELEYRTAEKEQEIELLSKEKALAEVAAQKQNQQRNGLILGSGLLLLALGGGALAYRKTKKYNRFLADEEQRKDALLQEVHHRTNNSLQLISALLSMQGEQLEDVIAKGALKQSESRIHSLSTLHEMLHQDATEIDVNMQDYLTNIIEFHSDLSRDNIEVLSNIAPLKLPAKTAMPLALICNELLTNALKYAFPNPHSKGFIRVSLNNKTESDDWVLSVEDNGIGIPNNAYQMGSGSTGSKLVYILCQQMNGELKVDNQTGACVSVFFRPQ